MVKLKLLNHLRVLQVLCETKLEKHVPCLSTVLLIQLQRIWADRFHLLVRSNQCSAPGYNKDQEKGQAEDEEQGATAWRPAFPEIERVWDWLAIA